MFIEVRTKGRRQQITSCTPAVYERCQNGTAVGWAHHVSNMVPVAEIIGASGGGGSFGLLSLMKLWVCYCLISSGRVRLHRTLCLFVSNLDTGKMYLNARIPCPFTWTRLVLALTLETLETFYVKYVINGRWTLIMLHWEWCLRCLQEKFLRDWKSGDYSESKLANVLFSFELQRRWQGMWDYSLPCRFLHFQEVKISSILHAGLPFALIIPS